MTLAAAAEREREEAGRRRPGFPSCRVSSYAMPRCHLDDLTFDRARFLRLGAAGAVGSALVLAGSAQAAVPSPAPVGDDVAYLQFGATAELVLQSLYGEIDRNTFFPADERRRVAVLRAATKEHVARLAAVLGGDAPQYGDFHIALPPGKRSRRLLLGKALDLTGLLAGTYLSGVSDCADPATRTLLGRLLWSEAQQLSQLRAIDGRPVTSAGLPGPISLEDAAPRLDAYLTDAVPPV